MIQTLPRWVFRETRIPSRCLEEKSRFPPSVSFWPSGTRWPVPFAGELHRFFLFLSIVNGCLIGQASDELTYVFSSSNE